MSCLWDNSQRKFGDMNYYDRENDEWFDKKIGENFKIISKGKFVKPSTYFEPSNVDIIRTPTTEGHMNIKIGLRENIFKSILSSNYDNKIIYRLSFIKMNFIDYMFYLLRFCPIYINTFFSIIIIFSFCLFIYLILLC